MTLTNELIEEIKRKILVYCFETDSSYNEDEHTYCPSTLVCDYNNICDILDSYKEMK